MTENECIEILSEMKRQSNVILENPTTFYGQKDILGGCETMKKHIFAYDIAIKALEEIQQYRAIGTVGRCRAAMEKCTPKIPNTWGDGCDAKGRIIYDMYDCPNCGKSYEIDYEKYDHCPACGQAIDWNGIYGAGE